MEDFEAHEVYGRYFWGKRTPLTRLADGWGLNRKLLVRDFKRWCEENGLDPDRFLYRGYIYTGYWAPLEFQEWWEKTLLPQYQRTGHASRCFDWSKVKRKKGGRR